MRIGIDARTILNPEKGEAIGVGHYTYQLIRHLLQIDKENEYVLFFDYRVREKDIKKFTLPNVKIKFYPFSDYKKYLPVAYNEILGSAILAKEKLDVLHTTSTRSRVPMSYRGRVVVTVHDLSPFKVPEVLPKIKRTRDKSLINLMVGKAEKIIAVSKAAERDLLELLKCSKDKIRVIYGGLDKRFFETSDVSREKVLEKYGVKDKYILFLGTIEPVKNISRLFEAFKIFRENIKEKADYKLVMAGKRGWLSDEFKQLSKDLEIEKDIIFSGYITGDDLVPLFHEAEFFVMPSLYEGFGTTVLEALAAGTPAIVSNIGSIPEITNGAAYMVNPLDTKEIARVMQEFAEKPEIRDSFRIKGKEQAKKFDWEKCAKETLEVYKSLLRQEVFKK